MNKKLKELLIKGKIENNADLKLFTDNATDKNNNTLYIAINESGYAQINKDINNQEIKYFTLKEEVTKYEFFYKDTFPELTEKEKEAIKIVVGLLDRRIAWLKENEPNAKAEIEANWDASAIVLELEEMELSDTIIEE